MLTSTEMALNHLAKMIPTMLHHLYSKFAWKKTILRLHTCHPDNSRGRGKSC